MAPSSLVHRVFLDALVHFLLVLIASVRRAELRIGEPILEAHGVAEVLESLLRLLNHNVHIGVRIGLPALGAIAPAEHETALGIGRTRNRFAELVARVAVVVGKLV